MDNKTIKELAVELTVEITAICDSIKGRSVFVNQLLRSCSSIGANAHEAKYAQSTADFIFKVNAINDITYKALISKSGTIRRKLIASITTAKKNKE